MKKEWLSKHSGKRLLAVDLLKGMEMRAAEQSSGLGALWTGQ